MGLEGLEDLFDSGLEVDGGTRQRGAEEGARLRGVPAVHEDVLRVLESPRAARDRDRVGGSLVLGPLAGGAPLARVLAHWFDLLLSLSFKQTLRFLELNSPVRLQVRRQRTHAFYIS